MNRRFFLNILLTVGSLAVPGFANASSTHATKDRVTKFAVKLLSGFDNLESARKIGREYLKIAPAEADINTLVVHIIDMIDDKNQYFLNANTAEIKHLLRNKSSYDFHNERVVSIQGWLLSKTEARLCALALFV
jgi:hypothetical protein